VQESVRVQPDVPDVALREASMAVSTDAQKAAAWVEGASWDADRACREHGDAVDRWVVAENLPRVRTRAVAQCDVRGPSGNRARIADRNTRTNAVSPTGTMGYSAADRTTRSPDRH
jgi:hypothetical protein